MGINYDIRNPEGRIPDYKNKLEKYFSDTVANLYEIPSYDKNILEISKNVIFSLDNDYKEDLRDLLLFKGCTNPSNTILIIEGMVKKTVRNRNQINVRDPVKAHSKNQDLSMLSRLEKNIILKYPESEKWFAACIAGNHSNETIKFGNAHSQNNRTIIQPEGLNDFYLQKNSTASRFPNLWSIVKKSVPPEEDQPIAYDGLVECKEALRRMAIGKQYTVQDKGWEIQNGKHTSNPPNLKTITELKNELNTLRDDLKAAEGHNGPMANAVRREAAEIRAQINKQQTKERSKGGNRSFSMSD
jgi:hypothetical protein